MRENRKEEVQIKVPYMKAATQFEKKIMNKWEKFFKSKNVPHYIEEKASGKWELFKNYEQLNHYQLAGLGWNIYDKSRN